MLPTHIVSSTIVSPAKIKRSHDKLGDVIYDNLTVSNTKSTSEKQLFPTHMNEAI